jgi:hypothetical protein
MNKSKLLKNKYPKLIKEWDYENNIRLLETVTAGCDYLAHWICAKGHKWTAVVYSRTSSHPTGCPHCAPSNRRTSPEYNLAVLYPRLLDEWDYNANIIDPHFVSPGTCNVYQWKCRYGHTWPSRVTHRVNGSGCPSCKGQSSKQQVFIYCEVRHFFPDAEYRKKIDGMECDIYLPAEKIGIEFDGLRYHKHKADVDATKINKLRDTGIEIVSIREYNLPLVNRLTVSYNKNCDDLEITKSLMTLLGRMLNRQDLIEYSLGNKQVGEQEYLKEMKTYPNSLGKTLANNNPELSMEWDYNNNGKLTPSDVAPYSHHIANWVCPQGHLYKAIISNRNLHKTGCPHCQNHSSLCYSDNKVRDPLHPKRIRNRSKKKRLDNSLPPMLP